MCRRILPATTHLHCVNVRVLAEDDIRWTRLGAHDGVTCHVAPELFTQRCTRIAPIDSNTFYDAKVWQFLEMHAQTGDVWWNIAGEGTRRS